MRKNNLNLLLVEDDKYLRLGIKSEIQDFGLVNEAASFDQAVKILNEQKIDLAIIDINLQDEQTGLDLLKLQGLSDIPTFILSSLQDETLIEQAYSLGARHFLNKSDYKRSLRPYINAFLNSVASNSIESLIQNQYTTQETHLIDQLKMLSQTNIKNRSLLLTGETGVGKSLLGKIIHQIHFDPKAPFIHLNCAEINENLIESTLFGHKKGSFTGANEDKTGLLEQANGGVLFLDEIGTMSLKMQKKLLKAIDEKSFYPVGSKLSKQTNFTLIAATCEDIFEKIQLGEFRKDFYFRVSHINIQIPALRERVNDIQLLIDKFLQQQGRRVVLKAEAKNLLQEYRWPGNIRELQEVIKSISLLPKGIIDKEDIRKILHSKDSVFGKKNELIDLKRVKEVGLKSYIKEIETSIVENVLEQNTGKVAKTISDLQISSSAFYRIIPR